MANPPDGPMAVVEVDAPTTFAVRRAILREGDPAADVGTSGDRHVDAIHLAAVVDGAVVGVVTCAPAPCPVEAGTDQWQLAGMAVVDPWQGRGVGTALVHHLVAMVVARDGRLVWARARDTALAFYAGLGFTTVGEGFTRVGLPHHHVVLRPAESEGPSLGSKPCD
ncbi:MAG: GCN5-related N-acetyltransferase [Acidimicrobiales bacterium]|nr:GCN5-related N-acetyltransferase [Acidimicrobiales bacterium]